jgi:hypothetical protein
VVVGETPIANRILPGYTLWRALMKPSSAHVAPHSVTKELKRAAVGKRTFGTAAVPSSDRPTPVKAGRLPRLDQRESLANASSRVRRRPEAALSRRPIGPAGPGRGVAASSRCGIL